MKNKDGLLPCPFCGGTEITYNNCDYGSGKWYTCESCGIQVKVAYSEDLMAAWNTRPKGLEVTHTLKLAEQVRDAIKGSLDAVAIYREHPLTASEVDLRYALLAADELIGLLGSSEEYNKRQELRWETLRALFAPVQSKEMSDDPT